MIIRCGDIVVMLQLELREHIDAKMPMHLIRIFAGSVHNLNTSDNCNHREIQAQTINIDTARQGQHKNIVLK